MVRGFPPDERKTARDARTDDPGWLPVRPPLVGLDDNVRVAFLDALAKAGLPVAPEAAAR